MEQSPELTAKERYEASKQWLAGEIRDTETKITQQQDRRDMANLQEDPEIREALEIIDEVPMTEDERRHARLEADGELAHLQNRLRFLGGLAIQLEEYANAHFNDATEAE